MMSASNTAIIIPAYNEGEAIKKTIQDIPLEFDHIICVDDGSSDDTSEQILSTRATLVRHPINLGQGAALQTGIEYSLLDEKNQYFVTYDADGQHRIEDVKMMLDYLRSREEIDIVLGSRFLGVAENIRPFKKLMLKLAVKFSNFSSGVKLTDTHNGLRVFNRKVAKEMQLQMADFAHASEIIDRIGEKEWGYKELPVTIVYTDYSVSKGQSMVNAVNIVFDLIVEKIIKK